MNKGDILGFYCFGRYDTSVALVRNGNIVAAGGGRAGRKGEKSVQA